jgi:cob(I)alamin adenosyltransferase
MKKASTVYRSPYEAYPFLADAPEDLRCDFELMTDRMASEIGLLRALSTDEGIRADLLKLCEIVYHMNPTLRTRMTVTGEEAEWLLMRSNALQEAVSGRCAKFVLTQGSQAGCQAHLLRVRGKELVRLLYRHGSQGHPVPERLMDLANLLSGYFFFLALRLNQLDGIDEIPYESRNYH